MKQTKSLKCIHTQTNIQKERARGREIHTHTHIHTEWNVLIIFNGIMLFISGLQMTQYSLKTMTSSKVLHYIIEMKLGLNTLSLTLWF